MRFFQAVPLTELRLATYDCTRLSSRSPTFFARSIRWNSWFRATIQVVPFCCRSLKEVYHVKPYQVRRAGPVCRRPVPVHCQHAGPEEEAKGVGEGRVPQSREGRQVHGHGKANRLRKLPGMPAK